MSQVINKETGDILGDKIQLSQVPVKRRRLFYPFLKNNIQVTFFTTKNNVFGMILNSIVEVIEP